MGCTEPELLFITPNPVDFDDGHDSGIMPAGGRYFHLVR